MLFTTLLHQALITLGDGEPALLDSRRRKTSCWDAVGRLENRKLRGGAAVSRRQGEAVVAALARGEGEAVALAHVEGESVAVALARGSFRGGRGTRASSLYSARASLR
jgi:hypothetical protein